MAIENHGEVRAGVHAALEYLASDGFRDYLVALTAFLNALNGPKG